MVIRVASVSDPRLDDYRNIPDPELLGARGIFIAEGRLVVRRLLSSSRFAARSVLVTPAARHALDDALSLATAPVYEIGQEAMNEITGFNIHRGCLAVGERPPAADWTTIVGGASRVIVLERVANADNVGAIFRNAAAFGADAVLLGPACADPLYRKAMRTSMGAALRVPFAALTEWPEDLAQLRSTGFTLLALTPSPSAQPLAQPFDAPQRDNDAAPADVALPGDRVAQPSRAANRAAPFRAATRLALLVGHEGDGLSAAALAAADVHRRIPMAPAVDSLNVATAAAVAMYELWQRHTSIDR